MFAALRSRILSWLRLLCIVGVAIGCLSGCVDYDVTIKFDSPNRGELMQQIHFGEQLQVLGGETVQEWIEAITTRTTALGGSVQRRPNQDLVVRLPFNNSMELEHLFNQFFTGDDRGQTPSPVLPEIPSRLTIQHHNFLLAEWHDVQYDLDLRSLGVTSWDGSILVSPNSLVDLRFKLETPLGAIGRSAAGTPDPYTQRQGKRLVWALIPGEQNHLEASFWLPSPLGIGAMVIAGLVLVGWYLKYPNGGHRQTVSPLKLKS